MLTARQEAGCAWLSGCSEGCPALIPLSKVAQIMTRAFSPLGLIW